MGVRDNEIKRLILYAKALGQKVIIRGMDDDTVGEYCEEDKAITINKKAHRSKTELILTITHEICHAKYKQLNNTSLSEGLLLDGKVPKRLRKEIRDFEVESLQLMTNIIQELNIKIPIWKVLRQRDFDCWIYEMYYQNGKFPDGEPAYSKWMELSEKYKK